MDMANSIEKILTSKKHRPLLFFIVGFFFLYLRARNQGTTSGAFSGITYTGNPYTGGGDYTAPIVGDDDDDDDDNGGGGTAPPVPIAPGSVLEENPGIFSDTKAGSLYEWVPSRNLSVQVQEDGKVKVVCPATKPSWDGSRTCKRIPFGQVYFSPVSGSDSSALFGDGITLPEGIHYILIGYFDAADAAEVLGNIDKFLLEPHLTGRADEYSAQFELLQISRVPETSTAPSNRIRVPLQLQRMSWLQTYQLLNYTVPDFGQNGFGTTRYIVGVAQSEMFKRFSHLQYAHQWMDELAPSKRWQNNRANGETNEDVLAGRFNIDPNTINSGQLTEDWANGDFDKSERVFHKVFQRHQAASPGVTPDLLRLFSDYYAQVHGYGLEANFVRISEAKLIAALGSQTEARKIQTAHTEDLTTVSRYIGDGAIDYRNYQGGGYIGNFLTTFNAQKVYSHIYNLEKYNLAAPNRRHGLMGWICAEGLAQCFNVNRGVFQALKFSSGEIIRRATFNWGFDTMFTHSFWLYLLGNKSDYWLWDDNFRLNTNPHTFTNASYASSNPAYTIFRNAEGVEATYNSGNSSHPLRISGPEGSIFPNLPQHAENGVHAARYLYAQIAAVEDRISSGIAYNPFTYKVNGGGALNGYRAGSSPETGATGARLSARGFQNPGQANIVKLGRDLKPILMKGTGPDGGVLICQNPRASIADVTQYITSDGTFDVVGPKIEIIKL